MTERCGCQGSPDALVADHQTVPFADMSEVSTAAEGWTFLVQCEVCSQHWQVDRADRLGSPMALKVARASGWPFDDTAARKRLLFAIKGGVASEVCGWKGCSELALRGLAYCVDCAYDRAGIRW